VHATWGLHDLGISVPCGNGHFMQQDISSCSVWTEDSRVGSVPFSCLHVQIQKQPRATSTCRLKSSPGQQCGKLLKNGKSGKRMLICCCSVPRHPSASPPPVSPDLTPTLGVAGRYRLCGYRETRSKLSHSLTRVGESLRSLLSSSSGKSGQWGHCEN